MFLFVPESNPTNYENNGNEEETGDYSRVILMRTKIMNLQVCQVLIPIQ